MRITRSSPSKQFMLYWQLFGKASFDSVRTKRINFIVEGAISEGVRRIFYCTVDCSAFFASIVMRMTWFEARRRSVGLLHNNEVQRLIPVVVHWQGVTVLKAYFRSPRIMSARGKRALSRLWQSRNVL